MFVWNAVQKREATDYYGVSPDKVVITGAPRFDSFMELQPSVDRNAYCRTLDLDPAAPIVTYLCSSEFVAGHETAFVEQWIHAIRKDPRLTSCNVIVRPHPRSVRQWNDVDLARHGRVGLSLSRVLNADQSLYDALYHSAAVVGLNTSAQIEAGILGKPVLTLLAPGFEKGQQGTLHFRYLLREEGGFVELAKDLDEHKAHLARAVTDGRRAEFASFAAFKDEQRRALIPDPNAEDTFERSRLDWTDRDRAPHAARLSYVRELLALRTRRIVPLIPQIAPGSGRYSTEASVLDVQWTTTRGATLELSANLAGDVSRATRSNAGVFFRTPGHTTDVERLAAWEVRLRLVRA